MLTDEVGRQARNISHKDPPADFALAYRVSTSDSTSNLTSTLTPTSRSSIVMHNVRHLSMRPHLRPPPAHLLRLLIFSKFDRSHAILLPQTLYRRFQLPPGPLTDAMFPVRRCCRSLVCVRLPRCVNDKSRTERVVSKSHQNFQISNKHLASPATSLSSHWPPTAVQPAPGPGSF